MLVNVWIFENFGDKFEKSTNEAKISFRCLKAQFVYTLRSGSGFWISANLFQSALSHLFLEFLCENESFSKTILASLTGAQEKKRNANKSRGTATLSEMGIEIGFFANIIRVR